ncbi:hypothetical protein ACFSTC_02355 [Nonomuraea ferruginea]
MWTASFLPGGELAERGGGRGDERVQLVGGGERLVVAEAGAEADARDAGLGGQGGDLLGGLGEVAQPGGRRPARRRSRRACRSWPRS